MKKWSFKTIHNKTLMEFLTSKCFGIPNITFYFFPCRLCVQSQNMIARVCANAYFIIIISEYAAKQLEQCCSSCLFWPLIWLFLYFFPFDIVKWHHLGLFVFPICYYVSLHSVYVYPFRITGIYSKRIYIIRTHETLPKKNNHVLLYKGQRK